MRRQPAIPPLVSLEKNLLVDKTSADVGLLALDGVEDALAHADALGRHLDELVVHDVLECLLERERARRA